MTKTILLSFDDAVVSHRTFVAPLLKQLGFGATFFICRWGDEWRKDHSGYLMTAKQIHELYEFGFDIGNHTWDHIPATFAETDEFLKDTDRLERFLEEEAQCPKAVSFAWPGGPGRAEIIPFLKERGFQSLRIVEKTGSWYWDRKSGNPLHFQSFAMHDGTAGCFEEILAECTEEHALALVYHGVPDIVHPWVTTRPETFEKQMRILKERGYRVLSFRQYFEENPPEA